MGLISSPCSRFGTIDAGVCHDFSPVWVTWVAGATAFAGRRLAYIYRYPLTIPSPNMTIKNTLNGFMQTSVRLLALPPGQQPDRADWAVAKLLIEQGHATGKFMLSHDRNTHGQVTGLLLFAPTLQGLLQADVWADTLHRRTWRHRAWQALAAVVSYAGGFASGVLADVSKTALTQWLGL